jgi:hypothetical protein
VAITQIGHFGIKDGSQLYILTGDKSELEEIINECRMNEIRFADTPEINHVHRSQWVLKLKIKIPVGVGNGDKKT